ncbi:hypothetical protein Tco_0194866 [Tanacetum coccineum]
MNICHHVEQAAAASTMIIENEGCVSTGFTDSFPMQNTTTPICEPSKVADETSKGTTDLDVAMNKNPIQSGNRTFSLSNSFEALNIENLVSKDVVEYVDNEIEVIWLQNRRRLDMEIPDNIVSIYDNLDIKVLGRMKK